jgi:hypothetical protein
MQTIHKYPLPLESRTVVMPAGSRILSVQVQKKTAVIWAEVDTGQPLAARDVRVFGTGLKVDTAGATFIDTVQLNDGNLVLHVFDGGDMPL